jgi:hypothetical protein
MEFVAVIWDRLAWEVSLADVAPSMGGAAAPGYIAAVDVRVHLGSVTEATTINGKVIQFDSTAGTVRPYVLIP